MHLKEYGFSMSSLGGSAGKNTSIPLRNVEGRFEIVKAKLQLHEASAAGWRIF
jgi:hypothetical protein